MTITELLVTFSDNTDMLEGLANRLAILAFRAQEHPILKKEFIKDYSEVKAVMSEEKLKILNEMFTQEQRRLKSIYIEV